MKTAVMETERLRLRPIRKSDAEPIFDCWMKDETVSRYMWWKASGEIKAAREFVAFELGKIENDWWYRWLIESKSTGELIGTCLVFYNEDAGEKHWDVSYNLGAKYWGKGYGTEAMEQVMQFAQKELHIHECVTTYAKENPASGKVLGKLGFRFIREEPYWCSGGEIKTTGIRVKWEPCASPEPGGDSCGCKRMQPQKKEREGKP